MDYTDSSFVWGQNCVGSYSSQEMKQNGWSDEFLIRMLDHDE